MQKTDLLAPEKYNITSAIEQYASDATKKAIIYRDSEHDHIEVTYQDLIKNANKVGNVFKKHGLKYGDKVLIMMPRAIATYELYIAALKLGIAIIPSSEMLRTKDLQYRVSHGEIDAVISFGKFIKEFEGLKEYQNLTKFIVGDTHPDWISIEEEKSNASDELEAADTSREDVAILSYTSGTTGNPKAVTHTHGWGYAHLQMAPKHWLCIKEDDLVWATAAPGWQKWVWSPFLSSLGSGATAFVYNGRFKPETYLELLQEYQINVLCCTPTEYRMMAKLQNLDDYHLEHLHSAVSAGEPLNREVVEQFKKYFNITVRDGYGQTESTLLIGFLKDTASRPGAMGKSIPGSYTTIIDDDGNEVEPNVKGNIAVPLDLPALFKGYFKEPERTAAARLGDYYVTGDLAHQDEDGYFWFEGRKDDIIISSGYTIGPFEVEDALTNHPAVKECAVVASPHELRGNIVKAFIILQNGYTGDDELIKELQTFTKNEVAPYKYPRAIEFVEDLPKTNSGKIRRVELRDAEVEKYNQEHE
ncbi:MULTISPECIES: acyl-CoA synthetase MbcS [Staphylococcus]|uniref:acyl-CoA synthetase MbcS n=1 Tax=Staphylococcus TaxID=1279 RepID=UPI0002463EFC|nr:MULTISPECIES: acyl--CoA ligase [Staphylococcus]MCR4455734.1 acyl--CoA ligase [Aeromonas salmonicida]QAV30578.1 acyl--CoA ligase [Sulfitobacter donghicola]AGZ25421.1 putative acetyl-coenzyme A synthetase [Staphylococcus pasteuri SP1]KAB7644319.1 acyl--CoA ligase [Staphylococcus sp. B2-b]MBN6853452.1 acyl--CoA ligase [Staphylococcus warneri]